MAHPDKLELEFGHFRNPVGRIPLQHLHITTILVSDVINCQKISRPSWGSSMGEILTEHEEVHDIAAV